MTRSRWLPIVIAATVLIYAGGVLLDISPYLRGPDEWRWPFAPVQHWDRLWPVWLVMLLIGGWVVWLDRRRPLSTRRQRLLAVGGLMLLAAALQLAALRMERPNPLEALFVRQTDIYANGYFAVGAAIDDVGDVLRRYPELMPNFLLHPQVHPPGIPLIYWWAGSVFEAAPAVSEAVATVLRSLQCNDITTMLVPDARLAGALAGMILPVIANLLTLACVFRMAGRRFGERAGLYAAAVWAMVPSAVIFTGLWSQVYPLLACLAWLAVDAGLKRRNIGWFFVAGLVLSVSTFMELGTAALALFIGTYILAGYWIERRSLWRDWKFLLGAALAGMLGVFSIWIVYQLAYGVSLAQIVAAMWPIHTGYQFNRAVWIVNHPYEFAVFFGLPCAVLLVAATVRAFRRVRSGQADPLSLSLGPTLLLLAVLDPARDETARTWMLFMPMAVVIIAASIVELADRPRRLATFGAGLAIQVSVMLVALQCVLLGTPPEVPSAALDPLPTDVTTVQANFGDTVRLVGYRLDRTALPDRILLDLIWQPLRPVHYPFKVFNHVLDAQGRLAAQQDDWTRPLMTCWAPGSYYLDRHTIPLEPNLPVGRYTLSLGLYDPDLGVRVPVNTTDDNLRLPPINLP